MKKANGSIINIKYHENNYLIAELDNGCVVKGNMISVQLGVVYEFEGKVVSHATFGDSFAFSSFKVNYPKDDAAVMNYLIKNAKWIGPEVVKKIVDLFGEKSLDVCKNSPEKLLVIPGITEKRAEQISAMLRQNEDNENLQIEIERLFTGTGISSFVINQIMLFYKNDAPQMIKENPYSLIGLVKGISFISADKIASNIDIKKDSEFRVKAGVFHVLKMEARMRGNTCLELKVLEEKSIQLLKVNKTVIECIVTRLLNDLSLKVFNGKVSIMSVFEKEKYIAGRIKELMESKVEIKHNDSIDDDGNKLFQDQSDAISKILSSKVSIITGAPGTGKTFTIQKIIELYNCKPNEILLIAPTGKAAKRMTEQTGVEAFTIHKALEAKKREGDGKFCFTRNQINPLLQNIIIIDEMSMVDVSLMDHLLQAIRDDAKIIMIGDVYQLPAIGAGNVLKDLIKSGVVPTSELKTIKRQNPGMIITNCHLIKDGKNIKVDNKSDSKDFYFIERESEREIIRAIENIISKKKDSLNGASSGLFDEIQVITPLRKKTLLGCNLLNGKLQGLFNNHPSNIFNGAKFRINDKIIQLKNDYNLGVVNGDIGYIKEVYLMEKKYLVEFQNPRRRFYIPFKDNNLDLAYAVTCHKFQGCEAPTVVIPIHKSAGEMIMQRNWLYTAISRAKNKCVLVGQLGEIKKIVGRNYQQIRFTNMKGLLNVGNK